MVRDGFGITVIVILARSVELELEVTVYLLNRALAGVDVANPLVGGAKLLQGGRQPVAVLTGVGDAIGQVGSPRTTVAGVGDEAC